MRTSHKEIQAAAAISYAISRGVYPLEPKTYKIKYVNHYEEYDKPVITAFESFDVESIKTILRALTCFYSGDPIECFIDGEQVMIDANGELIL